MNDFPRSADAIDFDAVSQRSFAPKQTLWTWKGDFEYFVEVEKTESKQLVSAITNALQSSGYSVSHVTSEEANGAVIGERGWRANEWGSVIGVYYRLNEKNAQVYLRNKITQDFTGGWRQDGAKQVASSLCTFVPCQRE